MPRSKHATLLAIATGALALYTLLAVAVFSHIATRERMDVRQSVDNMGWVGSHFQTEFYKFEQRLSAFAAELPGVDPTEVQLRFDIVLGRLETLRSGAQREVYGDNAELAQTYELIRGKVVGLEPVMTSVIGGDRMQIPAVLAVLRGLEAPVAKLANGISRFAVAERAALGASILRASNWLGVLLVGQVITLLILGSFLWRQFSELRRSQASLEASNKALTASQADVRRNEYRFRQFFNNMRDIIVCMGTKGQSDFGYDAGGVLLLGRDVDRIAGTRRATTGLAEVGKWYDAVHLEDRASYEDAERRRKENGEAYSLTYRFAHPETGEQRWATETGWATKDPASDAVFYDSYIVDVTEHKNLETQLRENQSILQSVVDNSPIGINVKDRAGRFVLMNRHLARLFGTTPDAAVGRLPDDVHGPNYRNPRHRESHCHVVESGEPIIGSEDIFAGVTGDETWITNKAPVKDAAGEVRYVVTVSMPVPQLATANKALAENRAMLLEAERQAKIVSWNQPLNSETGTVWSENITEILGLPPELVSSDATFLSYVHAEDRERVRAEFARTTENPGSYELDYRFVRPDGQTIWLRTTAKVHLGRERLGSRLIGTIQDITAQKTVELALRESKLHLHAAQRRARMAYWTWDVTAGESYVWSDEAAEILGLAPGAVPPLDKDFLNLIHPDDRARVAKEYDYTLNHHNEFEFFYRVVRPDGQTIWIRELAEPIMGADGRPLQMIGTIQDVTSQKQIEEALRESEARLRGFMDHAPMLISLKDQQERYRLVNRELIEFLGVSENAIVGKTVFEVFPRHIAERLSEDDRSVLTDGKVISREFSESDTFSRYGEVSVTKFPIRDAEGQIVGVGGIALDISERKRAEQALRESEARLRSFMHNAPVGMIIKSADRRFLMVNQFVTRAYNKPEAAFLGQRTSDLALSEGAQIVEELEQLVIESRKSASREVHFPEHATNPWTHQLRFPIFDDSGVIISIGGFAIDITERRNAEIARQETESLFRSFLENSPAGMAVKDRDGRFLLVNRHVEAEFGLPAREILGRRSAEIALAEAADAAESMDRHVLESGQAIEREIHLPARSDFEWTYAVKFPIKDAAGRITAIGGFGFDIGERKRAELALRDSEARLRSFMDNSPAAMSIKDTDRRFVMLNARAAQTLRGRVADIVGRRTIEVLPALGADAIDAMEREVVKFGKTVVREVHFPERAGAHWTQEVKFPIRDAEGRISGIGGFGIDISERKQTEIALRNSEALLREAQRSAKLAYWNWEASTGWTSEWSDSAGDVLGIAPLPVPVEDEDYRDLIHPDDRDIAAKAHHEIFYGLRPYNIEYRYRRADGGYNWIHESANVEANADGAPVRMVGTVQNITERKQMERALRESEARLRDAIESMNDGFAIFDADDRFVMSNAKFLTEFNDKTADLYVPGAKFEDILRDSFARGQIKDFAGREAKWLAERMDLHRLATGSIEQEGHDGRRVLVTERRMGDGGIAALRTDITKLKETEQALRESEARLRSFMDHAPFVAYLKDTEGRYVLVNREFQRVENRPESDFIGKTAYDLAPREEADAWTESDQAVLDEGGIVTREFSQSRLGSYTHTLNVKFPVRDSDGRIIGIAGYAQDITDRKQVELALRESESRLRRAQQQVRLAYWSWQIETEEYQWAPGAGLILGIADRDLPYTEAGYLELIHPDDRDRMKRLYDDFARSGSEFNHDFRVQRPDGGIVWMREIAQIEYDAAGRRVAVTGTIQDITEQHDLEEQLRQSQKMEAIGQLTGGIAHDFNNLLAVVLGNLELVTEQIGDNKKLAKGIDNAIRASLRGADLTQRLLAFARRQVLAPDMTDVNALIAGMRDLLTRPLGPTVEFSSLFANEIWPIEIDQSQLESALLNMALNARDAMPEGGRLTITTSNAHIADGESGSGGELQPGDYVLISVADTGGGMSEEVKSRAFDPFYTTKSLGKGTGLGLSMVYGFVKQSGGHIVIDSEVGVGTTMLIYLPRAGDGGAAASAKAEVAVPRAHGETILVLEDEADVATVAQRYLANLGYKVIVTADAESAMAKLASAPRVDLLLADVILGGKLDGRAVAKQAVARWPNLKVMFMSGYAPNGGSRDADGEPSAIHIAKPFQKADLARELRRVLDRESRNHRGNNQ